MVGVFHKSISLFMVYLVLSLVFFIANSSAYVDGVVTGEKNVPNMRASYDITRLSLETNNDVYFRLENLTINMTCTEGFGVFNCNHTFSSDFKEGGEYSIVVYENDSYQGEIDHNISFMVDGNPPTINSFNLETSQGGLIVSYSLTDTAYTGTNTCSGIRKISISVDGLILYTNNVVENTCFKSDQFFAPLQNISGEVNFYMVVEDGVGNIRESEPILLDVDFFPPFIENNLQVLNGNRTVDVIGARNQVAPIVRLEFNVQEMDISNVVVDASEFSADPIRSNQYKSMTAYCNLISDSTQKCVVSGITLNPSNEIVNLYVNATDSNGNIARKTLQKTFTVVDENPVSIYLGPSEEHCFEDLCYVGNTVNKIALRLDNVEADMYNSRLFLDSSFFNPNIARVPAINCNESGLSVECQFILPVNVDQTGVIRTLSLLHPATDSVGNLIRGEVTKNVIVDADIPVNVTNIYSSSTCPVYGETLKLNINVTDIVSPKLFIKTNILNATEEKEFSNICRKEDNFKCQLSISSFISSSFTENITIGVEDLGGNVLEIPYTLEVCEGENNVTPNFISSLEIGHVPRIDKRVATYMPVKTFIPFKPIISSNSVEILEIQHDGCYGSDYLAYDVQGAYILNKRSENPIMVVPIGGNRELLPDEIPVNCTLKFFMRKGNVRYLEPEEQLLYVDLESYNLELGRVDEAVQTKIDSLKGDIRSLDKKIDRGKKIHTILGFICAIAKTINFVKSVLAAVKGVVYGVAVAFAWAGSDSWYVPTCKGLDKIQKSLDKIWPIGKNKGADLFIKFGCFFYECGLCKASSLVSLFSMALPTLGQDYSDHQITFDEDTFTDLWIDEGIASKPKWQPSEFSNSGLYQGARTGFASGSWSQTGSALDNIFGTPGNSVKDLVENKKPNDIRTRDNLFTENSRNYNNVNDGGWLINPYKSIHFARSCLCYPGILYNYNKARQLKCKAVSCMEENARNGLPITSCEASYDQGMCLYYHSASYKKYGNWGSLWRGAIQSLIAAAPYLAFYMFCASTIRGMNSVDTAGNAECNIALGWKNVACSVSNAIFSIQELMSLQSPYDENPTDVSGTDYCEGLDYSE